MEITRKWKKLKRSHRFLVVGLVALIVYSCLGFFLVPVIVKNVVSSKLTDAISRKTSITSVRFNPFTLDVKIRGFSVAHKHRSGNLFGFNELEANFELLSIVKLAPIVSLFRLHEPYVDFTRNNDGTFDFQDIIENKGAGKKEGKGNEKRPLFSINNIQIENGKVTFHDAITGTGHEITDINISLPFVSDLPHAVKIYHEPHVRAKIDGAQIAFEGQSKPFYVSRETHLKIKLTDLDLSKFAKYLPPLSDLTLASGRLNTDLSLSFELDEGSKPVISLDGRITLKSIDIRKGGRKFMAVEVLGLEIKPSNLLQKKVLVGRISVKSPRIIYSITKGKEHRSASTLEQELPAKEKFLKWKRKFFTALKKATTGIPDISVDALELSNGEISFVDKTLEIPFKKIIRNVSLRAANVRTRKKATATFSISCGNEGGESLSVEGRAGLNPFQLDAFLSLENIRISEYSPYYRDLLNGAVDGLTGISARFHVIPSKNGDRAPAVNITGIKFYTNSLTVATPGDEKDMLSIKTIRVDSEILDPDHGSLVISNMVVSGGFAGIVRKKTGDFNLQDILKRREDGPGEGGEAEGIETNGKKAPRTGDMPLKVSIKKASIGPIDVSFTDTTLPADQKISISSLTFSAVDFNFPGDSACSFTLTGKTGDRGNFKITGSAAADGSRANANISLSTIPVAVANGYMSRYLNARFARGNISVKGKADFQLQKEKAPQVTFRGRLTGKDIVARDTLENRTVSTWGTIRILGIELKSVSPLVLKIDKFLVKRHFERVALDKKGKLNIARIFKLIREKDAKHDNSSHQSAPSGQRPAIGIGLFKSVNGTVDFIDRSVTPVFSARISSLNAVFRGLSNEPGTKADVQVEGIINNRARLLIKGKANPMVEPRYLNLTLKIENFGMNRLSPYTARYIGYMISKGKLNMDARLLLSDDTIDASDQVFLDQFTLGKKVESKTASNLPVKMAVSLLTDKKGHIKLNIPIKGNINDPEFSVGSVVFRIIRNLIVKVVTSPFSILSAAFGSGGQDLQYVYFDPGTSNLSESEMKKLDIVAKTMNNHPNLKIELVGSYDPQADREAIEKHKFDMLLKKAKYNDLGRKERKNITPADVKILPEEYEKYLKKAWKKAPIKKERNFLMLVKSQPVPVMEKMLRNYCKTGEEELAALARKRAERVERYLVEKGKVSPKRVFLVRQSVKKGKSEIPLTSVTINIK